MYMWLDDPPATHSLFGYRPSSKLCLHSHFDHDRYQSNHYPNFDIHQRLSGLYLGWRYRGHAYVYSYRRLRNSKADAPPRRRRFVPRASMEMTQAVAGSAMV